MTFHVGDHVYFIAQQDAMHHILDLSGKERKRIKNVMILGGNEVGYNTAKKTQLEIQREDDRV